MHVEKKCSSSKIMLVWDPSKISDTNQSLPIQPASLKNTHSHFPTAVEVVSTTAGALRAAGQG